MSGSEKKDQFFVSPPQEYPLIGDIKGSARDFVEEFYMNVEGKNLYKHMGVKPDKSFLLHGPPGTGKTLSTKVLNNSLNMSVPLQNKMMPQELNFLTMNYDLGNYGTAYLNLGSKIIQNFFMTAKNLAFRGQNVFLVFDEADVLFRSRKNTAHTHGEDTKVLETLMKNLQDVHDSEGVYVAIITNFKEVLDSAAIRSGRVDKKFEFRLPSYEERYSCFEYEINKVNKNSDYQVIRKYNLEELSNLTDGINYADINNIVEGAVKLRIKENFQSSHTVITPHITQKYLLKSLKSIEDSGENNKLGFRKHW